MARRFRFAGFEVDLGERELRRKGLKLKLHDKPFLVLALLLERAGHLVLREELHRQLWPDDTFVDFDSNLNTALSSLRRVLGDTPGNPVYIETAPRQGYRFIAHVTSIDDVNPALAPALALQSSPVLSHLSEPMDTARKTTILVTPFENLSGDPGQDYLSDGLTEEMITRLGQSSPHHLSVIARGTAMQYKGTKKSIQQIAGQHNIDYILEGSFRLQGERVRITAQLYKSPDQSSLWTEAYERDARDLLAIQCDVADRIAQSLSIKLLASERNSVSSASLVNPDAYDDYLKSLFEFNRRSQVGLRRSIEFFRQATEKDPQFAPAFAALASSYEVAAGWTYISPQEAYPNAKLAVQKALALDDTLADAHVASAQILHEYDWDWYAAEREYQRALELNPSSAVGQMLYAEFLTHAGRYSEALARIRRAQRLDPLSLIMYALVCFVHFHARQYDQAIAEGKRSVELDPNFSPAHYFLGEAYSGKGLHPQATLEFQRALDLSGEASMMSAAVASSCAKSGDREAARRILDTLLEGANRMYVSPYALAKIYISMDEKEAGLSMLEKALEVRAFELLYLRDEPAFDGLHDDPRFQRIIAQRGFPKLTR